MSNNITVDDLRNLINVKIYSNRSLVLIGLKKILDFFIDCEIRFYENLGSCSVLLSYFNTEVPCKEIFELWIYFHQSNDSSIVSLILEILIFVIRITELLGSYTTGNKIIERILGFHIKSIYRNLSSNIDILVIWTLRLLIEMSCFNLGSFILEIFKSFDFSHKVISKIMKNFSRFSINTSSRINARFLAFETPRTFMIRFIFCFLEFGPVSLKLELFSYKNIFYDIFSGLVKDDLSFMQKVLDIILQFVIFEKDIPRSIKMSIFNENVLNELIALYSGTDDGISRSMAIHSFLILLCTKHGMGICFECNGWYPKLETDFKKNKSLLIYNKILSSFIFKLKITQDILQQELFLKICQACPELIAYCASQFSLNIRFEPHLTISWLSISSVYQSLVLLPIPFMTFSSISSELILTTILENIIPSALTKVSLSSGLKHNNDLVVFFTANLIMFSINKYCQVKTILDKKNDFNMKIFEWKKNQLLLRDMFLKRLPDIRVIFYLFKSVWGKSSNLLKFSVVKLFVYYMETFPEIIFFGKHDYSSILMKGFSETSEEVSYGSLILYYLFRISYKFLPISKWWNKNQEFSETIFTALVKFYLSSRNNEFRNEYKNLISSLLISSNAFSIALSMDSVELILKTLDDAKCFARRVNVIVDFLGNSLMLFMNSPYKYMDDLVSFIFDYNLEIDRRFPSLVLIVLIEQWDYFFEYSMSSDDDKFLIASWLSRVLGFFTLNENIWKFSKIISQKLTKLMEERSFEIACIFNETKLYIEFLEKSFLTGVCSKSFSFCLVTKKFQNISFVNYKYSCVSLSDNFVLIDFILHGGISQLYMHFDNIIYHIRYKYINICLLDVIVLKMMIYVLFFDDREIIYDFNDVILKYFKIIKSIGDVLRGTKDYDRFKMIIIENDRWFDNYLNFGSNFSSFKVRVFSKEFIYLVIDFIKPLDSCLLFEIMNKTYENFIEVLTNDSIRNLSLSSDEWNEIFLLLEPYWSKDQFFEISAEVVKIYIQQIHTFSDTRSDILDFFNLVFGRFFTLNNIEIVTISDFILIFNIGLKNGYSLNNIFELLIVKICSLSDDSILTFYEFIGNVFFLIFQNTENIFFSDLISKICSESVIFLEIICEKVYEIVKKSGNISTFSPFFFPNLLCFINAYVLWKDYPLEKKKLIITDTLKDHLVFLLRFIEDDLLNGFLDQSEKGFILFQILHQSIKLNLLFENGENILDKLCISDDNIILNKRSIEIIELATYKYGNEIVEKYIGIWFNNIIKLLIKYFSDDITLSEDCLNFIESFANYLKLSGKMLSKYVSQNLLTLLIEFGLKNHILIYNVVRFIYNVVKELKHNIDDSTSYVSLILSKSSDWKDINTNSAFFFEHRLIIAQLLHYFICNLSTQIPLYIIERIYNVYTGTTNAVDVILLDILQKYEELVRYNFFNKKIILNIQSETKKDIPLEISFDTNNITIFLSSEILKKSIYSFPIANESLLDFSQIYKDDLWLYCDIVENVYDSSFFLPLVLAYFVSDGHISIKFLIDSNILGYVLISLSSNDKSIRKMALTVLSMFENKIVCFSEKNQILMFFQLLKSSISLSGMELGPIPYVSSLFMALSIQIIINPSHFLFDDVCRFYLQRSKLDFYDIPIFFSLWDSSHDYYKRSNWLMSFLSSGLRTLSDYNIYKKRHIFELMCCLFSSEIVTNDIRSKIIKLFWFASNIYEANVSLVRDYGIASWIDQQITICKNETLKKMLERLFLRFQHSKLSNLYKYKLNLPRENKKM
ncbi:hypothetical protein T552_01702 [Pneumocystis carinii B80]|uniref:Nucleolar pre-ribosomal-associated protein 1 C-terminal domain-containing protein n=1 Tax=Pneumocystis carinii (strain B80) TaxID=1408658 RepID=A0A0W4ZJ88_PNEC8|nr:hypothetical protein T552_01702 [Pneumocystis carinii B80]KTW28440.1 hypothetical protein T552_01702 [Pneumocystis carinii B80]